MALIPVVLSLLLLGGGVLRRNHGITAAALISFVVVAVLSIPLFIVAVARHDEGAVSAFIALDSAAAIALTSLLLWRVTRRYPAFPAAALIAVGTGTALLMAFS